MSLIFNFLNRVIGIFNNFVNISGAGDRPKQRLTNWYNWYLHFEMGAINKAV